jgi:hypothetical protein
VLSTARDWRDDLHIKNLLNPFAGAASFRGARLGDIETNAFFRITTHRIPHSTPVSGVLLLNDVTAWNPIAAYQRLRDLATIKLWKIWSIPSLALLCSAALGPVR